MSLSALGIAGGDLGIWSGEGGCCRGNGGVSGGGGDGEETSDMKVTLRSRPFASMRAIVHIPLLAGDSLHVQRLGLESTFTLSAERGLLQATRFIQLSVVSA